MADPTAIANMALSRIRIGSRISSLSEQTQAAKTCNFWFAHCRKALLRSLPWSFAQRSVALAASATQTFPGWSYVYGYPPRALKVNFVADEAGIRIAYSRFSASEESVATWPKTIGVPFALALGETGTTKVILSDLANAYAFYTVDVEDVSLFPEDAASALAWSLAAEIAGPLSAASDVIAEARQMAAYSVVEARGMALNEERPDAPPESPSISARY